jgi:hypothetical protein
MNLNSLARSAVALMLLGGVVYVGSRLASTAAAKV